MSSLLALAVVFLIFAIGDTVATKTKAIMSMLFVCSVVFLVAFWCGLPSTIFTDAGLSAFSSVTICMFMVHIGSTIKLADFIKEWKTVLVVLCSTIAIALGVYFIGSLIIDRYYAMAGGPVLAGGMVAYLVVAEIGDAVSRTDVATFAVLVLSFQAFAGVPIASWLCKQEGKKLLERWKKGEYKMAVQEEAAGGPFAGIRVFPSVPEKYNSSNLILFKLAIIGFLGQRLAAVTGVNQLIFSLLLGVFFHEIGLLDEGGLTKSNGFTFVMAGALSNVFSGLASATPELFLAQLGPLVIVIVIGVIVAAVVSIIVGKMVGFGWQLSFAVAVTALFGFPGTYLVSREVSTALGTTEEEEQVVMSFIMPKMLIGGIVSVSVVSGLVASIMIGWI